MQKTALSVVVAWMAAAGATAFADVPLEMNVQGRLVDKTNGAAMAGPVRMRFSLRTDPTAGQEVWSQDFNDATSVALDDGNYSVTLTGLDPTVLGTDVYLEVQVGTEILSPRVKVASVPYALKAEQASSADALALGCVGCVQGAQLASVPAEKIAVPTAGCSTGQVLRRSSAGAWECADAGTVTSVSGTAPISVTNPTTTPAISIADATAGSKGVVQVGTGLSVSSGTISVSYGTAAGTAAVGNDSRLSDARAPTGAAGGDLSGTYPNPTVAKLQGRAVATDVPTAGKVLKWDSTNTRWYPGDDLTQTGTGGGTVTSVGLSISDFSVSGTPVTGSGTLMAAWASKTARTVLAGPTSGTAAAPTFRPLEAADIATGALALARGGTGADLSATGGTGQYVKQGTAGGALTVGTIAAADVTGTLAVARGGTGGTSFTASQLIRMNSAGTALESSGKTVPTGDIVGTTDTQTLTNKTWQGAAIAAGYGGTGQSSYAVGDLLYASGAAALSPRAAVADGNVLRSAGVATAPQWGKVRLSGATTDVTGTLPVGSGGTNSSTALNNNRVMVSIGGAIVERAAMTDGQLLIGSTGAAPAAATLTAGTGISITNAAGSITIASTGGGGAPGGSNGQVQFNSSGSFGADAALVWDNTNKRLGLGTTGPSNLLEIVGPTQGTTGNNILTNLAIYTSDAPGADKGGSLGLGGNLTGTTKRPFALIYGRKENATDNNRLGYLAFATGNNTAANYMTEHMRINSAGNVGIGTTAPAQKLHVNNGTLRVEGTTAGRYFDLVSASAQTLSTTNDLYIDTGGAVVLQPGSNVEVQTSAGTKYVIFDGPNKLMRLMAQDTTVNCIAANEGALRYSSACNCSIAKLETKLQVCMRNGASTYIWDTIKTYSFTLSGCNACS